MESLGTDDTESLRTNDTEPLGRNDTESFGKKEHGLGKLTKLDTELHGTRVGQISPGFSGGSLLFSTSEKWNLPVLEASSWALARAVKAFRCLVSLFALLELVPTNG